jgi:undecaprenyl-diphosphatase
MTNIKAVIFGIIQGLTEFIPISSSGHLVIFQNLLGLEDTSQYIMFDILLHIGTLVSVLFFYWKDVLGLIKSFFSIINDTIKGKANLKQKEHRLLIAVIIGTLPLFVAVLIKSKIESLFSSIFCVGFSLLVTGVILFLTDKIGNNNKTNDDIPYKSAFIVGLFQLFAILPGISRSGSTIFGGVLSGFKKEFAVKFSLLLSIFAILGATAASVPDVITGGGISATPFQCVLGMLTSAVSGIMAIKFLVRVLNKGKFKYFAFYCWAVGILTLFISYGVR